MSRENKMQRDLREILEGVELLTGENRDLVAQGMTRYINENCRPNSELEDALSDVQNAYVLGRDGVKLSLVQACAEAAEAMESVSKGLKFGTCFADLADDEDAEDDADGGDDWTGYDEGVGSFDGDDDLDDEVYGGGARARKARGRGRGRAASGGGPGRAKAGRKSGAGRKRVGGGLVGTLGQTLVSTVKDLSGRAKAKWDSYSPRQKKGILMVAGSTAILTAVCCTPVVGWIASGVVVVVPWIAGAIGALSGPTGIAISAVGGAVATVLGAKYASKSERNVEDEASRLAEKANAEFARQEEISKKNAAELKARSEEIEARRAAGPWKHGGGGSVAGPKSATTAARSRTTTKRTTTTAPKRASTAAKPASGTKAKSTKTTTATRKATATARKPAKK